MKSKPEKTKLEKFATVLAITILMPLIVMGLILCIPGVIIIGICTLIECRKGDTPAFQVLAIAAHSPFFALGAMYYSFLFWLFVLPFVVYFTSRP